MIGDQLWIIRGRQPVIWTVPMYVAWKTAEHGYLFFATQLSIKQQQAVEEVLRLAATPYQGMWRISRTHLEQIGELTTGGDPANYLSWERPRPAMAPENKPEKRAERDEFLDGLYQCGVGKNRDEVEYWWNQFCKHALDWLLVKDKPVDMYFLRLHPTRYRANWKQVLLGRFSRLGALLCHCSGKDREYFAHKSGLSDEMVSLDLLAMRSKPDICYRMVEVEHRPTWWKNMLRIERGRLRRLGSSEYAASVMAAIRGKFRVTLNLYCGWLTNVARPSASDVETGYNGEFRLVPNLSQSTGVRLVSRKSYLVPVVTPNAPPKYQAPSNARVLYPAHALVPQVPSFQSNPEKLRNARGVLYQPAGRAEPPRVLVRTAGEEPIGRELLALQRNGGA